jgi:hypothetical protein
MKPDIGRLLGLTLTGSEKNVLTNFLNKKVTCWLEISDMMHHGKNQDF